MADEVEQPRRGRGRPRMPAEDKKRHSMTFRMRTDLRAAVEQVAQANGRSLSEQIEYYVEASVNSERRKSIQVVAGSNEPGPTLPKTHHSMQSVDVGRLLLMAVKDGAIAAIATAYGSDVASAAAASVEPDEALAYARAQLATLRDQHERAEAEIAQLGFELSLAHESASSPQQIEAVFERILRLSDPGFTRDVFAERSKTLRLGHSSSIVDSGELLQKIEDILGRPGKSLAGSGDNDSNYSIDAFVNILAGLKDQSPDLTPLHAAMWPRKFSSLPADTRAALIGALQADAPGVYEALTIPIRPTEVSEPPYRPSGRDLIRGEAMAALRRLQRALLPTAVDDDVPYDDSDDAGAAVRRSQR